MPFSNIDKPNKYFDTILYTGTGASNTRTGLEFKPDFVLIKSRSAGWDMEAEDAVRGATKILSPKTTNAEETDAQGVTSFNSNGFTLGTRSGINASGDTYVAWNWLGANTTVSNTAGSITSTVSANTTSGFSIVSYTGTRTPTANQSIGHGLGVAPSMIIVKNRTTGTRGWRVYHKSLGTPDKELILNSTAAVGTDTATWQNTTPTSSLFYVGASGETNNTGDNFIAYCFAEVKGYSKFSSYTGNGSTDGTFVYTGFKPAFVLIKRSSTAGSWHIYDNQRPTFNLVDKYLQPNSSAVESSGDNQMDFLSNGFKLRSTNTGSNENGTTIIYMAFASSPFVSSKSIPTTAR